MFDSYYCIKTFCRSKTLEKMLACTHNGAERHVTCERFENTATWAKTNFILTSWNFFCYCAHYWWWCQFLWPPPECSYVKPQSTSTALLIHGFLPVKKMAVTSVWHSLLYNKKPKGQRSLTWFQCAMVKSHFKKHINGPWKQEARNQTHPSFYACPGYQQLWWRFDQKWMS